MTTIGLIVLLTVVFMTVFGISFRLLSLSIVRGMDRREATHRSATHPEPHWIDPDTGHINVLWSDRIDLTAWITADTDLTYEEWCSAQELLRKCHLPMPPKNARSGVVRAVGFPPYAGLIETGQLRQSIRPPSGSVTR